MFNLTRCPRNQNFNLSNVQLIECSTYRMFNLSNVQLIECSTYQMFNLSNVQLIECLTYRDVHKIGSKFQRIGSLGLFDEFLVEPQQLNK